MTETSKPTATGKQPATVKKIKIVARRDGHRRCGMRHSGTQLYPIDRFSDEEFALLSADPQLVVSFEELPDQPIPEGDAGSDGGAPQKGASTGPGAGPTGTGKKK